METMTDMPMMGLAHKPKPPKKVKDTRKHGIDEMHIKMHHDGTHQITHHHIDKRREPAVHGTGNLEELHDHIEQMLGGKPSKEELMEHGEE